MESLKTIARLGHYAGREGRTRLYRSQALPDRPAKEMQSHEVRCNDCNTLLTVMILSPAKLRARRAAKVLGGVAIGLVGLILALWAANQPSNPETFEYPAWVTPTVFTGVAIIIVGLTFLAFGLRDPGVRIYPRQLRSRTFHWVVR